MYPHSADVLDTMLNKRFKKLQFPFTTHDFRHAKLTDLGSYLTAHQVRDYAGHASIKTTDKYLHSNQEEVLRLIAERTNVVAAPEVISAERKRSEKRVGKRITRDPDNSDFHSLIAKSVANGT